MTSPHRMTGTHTMNRIILVIAAAAALLLTGCGTSSTPTADTPAAPAPEATQAPEPPAAEMPAAPEPADDDAADLGSLPASKAQACADMLPFFASGRDTAGWNPDTAAGQIIESMSGSPEWNAASDERREQIAGGIRQAAGGSC